MGQVEILHPGQLAIFEPGAGSVNRLAALTLADGRSALASGAADGSLRLWDPAGGHLIGQPVQAHQGWVLALTAGVRADGEVLLASAGADGIRRWDPATMTPLGPVMQGHSGKVLALTTLRGADGRLLIASGGEDATVRLWDAATGEPLGGPLAGHTAWVRAVTPVPLDGGRTLLASAGGDRTVRWWNPPTGTPAGRVGTGHTSWVLTATAVRLPAGGWGLASAGHDRVVRLWDAESGERALPPLVGHHGAVEALASLPPHHGAGHGAGLVSAGEEAVRLWDLTTGGQVGVALTTHEAKVRCVSPLRDARTDRVLIASSDHSGTILVTAVGDDGFDPTVRVFVPGAIVEAWPASAADGGFAVDDEPGETGPVDDGAVTDWSDADLDADADAEPDPDEPTRPVPGRIPAAEQDETPDPTPTPPDGVPSGGEHGTVLVGATRPVADDVPPADILSRGVLAAHLAVWLRQLAADRRSLTSVVHLDGRAGSGRSTLVELLLRELRTGGPDPRRATRPATGPDPVVVAYDAWRESVVAPEWWTLAAAINRRVRATRSPWTRAAMTVGGAAARLVRSVPVTVAVLAGAAALVYLVTRSAWDVAETMTNVLALVATVGALVLTGVRLLFWQSPMMSSLSLRGDDSPLGTVAAMIGWLRRWSPRATLRQRQADSALGVVVAAAAAASVAQAWGAGRGASEPELTDPRTGTAALVLVALGWWVSRLGADESGWLPGWQAARRVRRRREVADVDGSTMRDLDGGRSPRDGDGSPDGGAAGGSTAWTASVVAVALCLAGVLTLLGVLQEVSLPAWSWAWTVPLLVAAGAAAVHVRWSAGLADGGRERRPVLLVLDNLDRCPADRVVNLMESVHTLMREAPGGRGAAGAPRGPLGAWRGWRCPARMFVLVLADGRWVREAFEQRYEDFEGLGTPARRMGADAAQAVVDHTVLVPPLSQRQVRRYLDAVLSGPDGALVADAAGQEGAGGDAAGAVAGSGDGDPTGRHEDGRDDVLPGLLAPVPGIGAAAVERAQRLRDELDSTDPQRLRSDDVESRLRMLPEPQQQQLRLLRVVREAGAEGISAGERHVLARHADLLPANPRLIKRVANALAMLLAVKDHLRHEESLDVVARAAVLFVTCPTLVDDLLDAVELPRFDPGSPWGRADVRRVLTAPAAGDGDEGGERVLDLDAPGGPAAVRAPGAGAGLDPVDTLRRIALCFGKVLAPATTGPVRPRTVTAGADVDMPTDPVMNTDTDPVMNTDTGADQGDRGGDEPARMATDAASAT